MNCFSGKFCSAVIGTALCSLSYTAVARLPPPTPQEVAAQQAAKADKARTEAREKEALAAAQDRVAQRYIAEQRAQGHEVHPTGVNEQPGNAPSAALPEKATQAAGAGGPHGGTTQSAESHSAPSH